MWLNVLFLVLVVGALLLLLEILHAFFHSAVEGQREDTERDDAEVRAGKTGCLALLHKTLRALVNLLLALGTYPSLIFHEVSHALVHAAMGARPRIVLLQNGGYAKPAPWFGGIGGLPLVFGYPALGGIAGLAPILTGGFLYISLLVWRTPIEFRDLVAAATPIVDACAPARLADLPAVLLGTCGAYANAVRQGGALAYVVLAAAGLLTAVCLTPSSTDFVAARDHLIGNAAAAVLAAWTLEAAPRAGPWLLLLGGIVVFAAYVSLLLRKRKWAMLPGALGTTLIVLALLTWTGTLGAQPARGIALGIGMVVQVLLLAGAVLLVFLVALILLNVVGLQFDALGLMLRRAPKELRDVFTPIHTCLRCALHFHGKCEGCGRTPEEIAAAGESA